MDSHDAYWVSRHVRDLVFLCLEERAKIALGKGNQCGGRTSYADAASEIVRSLDRERERRNDTEYFKDDKYEFDNRVALDFIDTAEARLLSAKEVMLRSYDEKEDAEVLRKIEDLEKRFAERKDWVYAREARMRGNKLNAGSSEYTREECENVRR